MYGWRARIGIIYPCSGLRDHDFHRLCPEGVSAHITRVRFRSEGTVDAIREMSEIDHLVEAARLLAEARPVCITWADTSGSFLFGEHGDRAQTAAIEEVTKIPASTTSTACLAAFDTLGISRLAIASPYLDEVNVLMKAFLSSRGITVVNMQSLELRQSDDIARAPRETIYRLARAAVTADAEGLFVPCTDFLDIDLIALMERDFRVPVVAANAATMWHALRLSGIADPIDDFGKLLRSPLRASDQSGATPKEAASHV